MSATTFPALLRAYMARGGWSNGTLGKASGHDHSLISRLRADLRQPSRLVVEDLAAALALTPAEADALFVAAGYVPADLPHAAVVAALGAARKEAA